MQAFYRSQRGQGAGHTKAYVRSIKSALGILIGLLKVQHLITSPPGMTDSMGVSFKLGVATTHGLFAQGSTRASLLRLALFYLRAFLA